LRCDKDGKGEANERRRFCKRTRWKGVLTLEAFAAISINQSNLHGQSAQAYAIPGLAKCGLGVGRSHLPHDDAYEIRIF
jgi:hypothetical protein